MTTYSYLFILAFAYVIMSIALANPLWPITDLPFEIYRCFYAKKTRHLSWKEKKDFVEKEYYKSLPYKSDEMIHLFLAVAWFHVEWFVGAAIVLFTFLILVNASWFIPMLCGSAACFVLLVKLSVLFKKKMLAYRYELEYKYVKELLSF